MKLEMDYVDRIYEFRGIWDSPSHCGLKIVKKTDRHIVIATELYDTNPGTSITNFGPELASRLCEELALDPEKLVFIEHCPQSGSRLEAYAQSFDRVDFDFDGEKHLNPCWTRMSKEEVDALIAS